MSAQVTCLVDIIAYVVKGESELLMDIGGGEAVDIINTVPREQARTR